MSYRVEDYHKIRKRMKGALGGLIDKYLVPTTDVSAFSLAPPTVPENIIGFGLGEKYRERKPTGELSLKVYVVEKIPEDRLEEKLLLPKSFQDFDVDVEAVGRVILFANDIWLRPAPGGVSIGHKDITAGTLGCIVEKEDELYILSNNHVLANQNRGQKKVDPILQPGPADGGVLGRDDIAILTDFKDVVDDGKTPNLIDAAIAKPKNRKDVTPEIIGIGLLRGIASPKMYRTVKKSGRTTHVTQGIITDLDVTVRIPFGRGIALFEDQILIRGVGGQPWFSMPGDSGSLILDNLSDCAMGLLFAGSVSQDITFANRIEHILKHFNVKPGMYWMIVLGRHQ